MNVLPVTTAADQTTMNSATKQVVERDQLSQEAVPMSAAVPSTQQGENYETFLEQEAMAPYSAGTMHRVGSSDRLARIMEIRNRALRLRDERVRDV